MSEEIKLLSQEEQALRLQVVGDVSKFTAEQLRAFLSNAGALMGGTDLPGLQDNIGINTAKSTTSLIASNLHQACESTLGEISPLTANAAIPSNTRSTSLIG